MSHDAGSVIILMGGPGAGKDSQAKLLAPRLGAAHISSGDEIRRERDRNTDLEAIMARGDLIPEDDFERILRQAILRLPRKQPIILDGVTKKPAEVDWLLAELHHQGRAIEAVLFLDVSEDVSLQRILTSQRGRDDDAAEVQARRWKAFRKDTLPSIERYRQLGLLTATLDANADIETVAKDITAVLGR